MRTIDFEITEMNGGRDITGMIGLAHRTLDERVRTILCIDGSGNEAIVLWDGHGTPRLHETMRSGVPDLAAIADAIADGVPPSAAMPYESSRWGAILTTEEKAAIDDGQGWWDEPDEVELVWQYGHVTMVVVRRAGPDEAPEVLDHADWIGIDKVPTSAILRMLKEGVSAQG